MSRIRPLAASVVNQIAAGEVIERPASVVKELLENSLDALATRIEVDVESGGIEAIRIVDDGEGIHPDDLPLAVASHATSKLATAEDLFRVHTLGFRGEALASIASVSRMRIRTRRADALAGVEVEIDRGTLGTPQPCGCPPGTQIEIRQLFHNTPVRRKFLRTPATELGYVAEQFTRIALAHPRLHATLRHNGKIVHELPATDRLLDRLHLFHGAELAEDLIEVESEAPGVRLWGYVAHPRHSKSTRKGQHIFLNGRCIQDRALQHALGEAYRGLLMVGRFPIAFLFLEMPPESVDVNVHPTKAEVRFLDGQQPYRQLLSTLRTRFLGLDLDGTMRVPVAAGARSTSSGTGTLELSPPRVDPERQRQLLNEFADWAKDVTQAWRTNAPGDERPLVDPRKSPEELLQSPRWSARTDSPDEPAGDDSPRRAADGERESTAESDADEFGAGQIGAFDDFGPSRAMQVHDCYLVVETGDGLTVIDQHALHERILYEHLRRRVLEGAVESQRLLVPETVELGTREAAALAEHRDLLAQLGLSVEEFGGGTVLLTAYPPMLARADRAQLVRDVAEKLDSPAQPTRRDLLDELLHMMSCKGAIKSGQKLSPEEMSSLLAQRHLVNDAHHCPHGRPTALVLSRNELDRQFGRLG
ncbi:MAG: DNA mismatch repair endonuclease MutL [Planctomycetaceae bacterium]